MRFCVFLLADRLRHRADRGDPFIGCLNISLRTAFPIHVKQCNLKSPFWLKLLLWLVVAPPTSWALRYFVFVDSMGKVHGSLARAGKVKNQTPKVAKAEKKKKMTGRAKKRFVYNRRFVSVVKGGAKRGPNSNNK
ncbi:unnamed protein product [Polarella glacialis]|uniref:40S ribosomal protein S30 n=1 Tax=Polarella glacialis TaxID=89957 RepID=A0A813I1I6_POLGL|nr:unnamed protein product [Polarella glacialis]